MKTLRSKSSLHFLTITSLLISMIGGAVYVTPVHAATFTVSNLNDSDAGSLRQAIMDANTAPTADTITFSLSGTIILDSTLPNITDAAGLTIDGTGQNVSISGGNAVHALNINSGASLTLNNLTIANSKISFSYGGGISNFGTLTVTNSTFSVNSAISGSGNAGGGGIYNGAGTLIVTNSTFSGNSVSGTGIGGGGGIYSINGTLTVTNSTFSGNSATWGGGIYNTGVTDTATITNSTFSGNSATGGFGGGGIYTSAGTLNLTNSTFSGNSAAAGGSGIFNNVGTVTLRNTIVANSASGGNCSGTNPDSITNGGNNVDDGTTCGWGFTNGSINSTNPLLGALANNGGPTQTFALLTGSLAIDGVTFNTPNSAPSTDQRGVARPQGVRYDIGAYETTRQSGPNFVVNALADPGDGICEYAPAGNCTLREAIIAANTRAGADTITFSISGAIKLGSMLPFIADTAGLTMDGTGQELTISGNNAVQVMQVSDFSVYGTGVIVPLTLNHLTIANGKSVGGSGIGNIEGTLTITNSTFSGNSSDYWGGGIYNSAGTLIITNSTFSGNNSTSGGGGIYTSEGTLTITNSTFSGNSGVDYDGGGSSIFNNMGIVTLRNTIVANGISGGNCSGTITNGGNNLDDGITCGWGAASGSKSNTNPLLGALANNGGSTQTFALLTGSPAIDGVTFNAPNSAPLTDQRGVARPQGLRYDIGAVEGQAQPLWQVFLPLVLK